MRARVCACVCACARMSPMRSLLRLYDNDAFAFFVVCMTRPLPDVCVRGRMWAEMYQGTCCGAEYQFSRSRAKILHNGSLQVLLHFPPPPPPPPPPSLPPPPPPPLLILPSLPTPYDLLSLALGGRAFQNTNAVLKTPYLRRTRDQAHIIPRCRST